MENKTRFAKVIKYIKESIGDNQNSIAEKISEKVNGVNANYITRFKSGAMTPDENVIKAMQEIYHINSDFLRGTSTVMLDGAGKILEQFNTLFSQWSTAEKTYTNSDGVTINDKYLHITMKEAYYNFLLDVDSTKFFQEQGMNSFDEELEKSKRKCNNTESNDRDYILIPRNCFVELVTAEIRNRKLLDELLDLEKHQHYCDVISPKTN